MKVSFLHLLHPNICLQADEKAQAQRRAHDPKDVDPKDVESEAHGPEKESLSENAADAEDSQWTTPLVEVCVECCDAKFCCFAPPI